MSVIKNSNPVFNPVVRIANVSLPGNKACFVALSYVRGIGRTIGEQICKQLGIDMYVKIGSLSNDEIESMRKIIATMVEKKLLILEEELTKFVVENIKDLRKIGSYRGLRHGRGLPVRGQSTKKNARTRKGRRSNAASSSSKSKKNIKK